MFLLCLKNNLEYVYIHKYIFDFKNKISVLNGVVNIDDDWLSFYDDRSSHEHFLKITF